MKTHKVTSIAYYKPGQVSKTKLAPITFGSITGDEDQLEASLREIGFNSSDVTLEKLQLLRFIFGHWDYNSVISQSSKDQLNAFKALIDKGVNFHSKYCAQNFDQNELPHIQNNVADQRNDEAKHDGEAKHDASVISRKHQLIFHYLYRPGEKAAIESKVTALEAQTNNLIIALSAFMNVDDAVAFVKSYHPNSRIEDAQQSEEEKKGEENADNNSLDGLAKIVYALKLRDADAETVKGFLNKIKSTHVPVFTNLTQVNSYIDYVNNMVKSNEKPITYLDASGNRQNNNSDDGTPKKYYATILKGVSISPDEMESYNRYLREYSILKAIFTPKAEKTASVRPAQVAAAPEPQEEILSLGDPKKTEKIIQILKYLKENEIYRLAPRKTATYARFKTALEQVINEGADPLEALVPFTSNIHFNRAKADKIATGQQANLAVSINKYRAGVGLLASPNALNKAASELGKENESLKTTQAKVNTEKDKEKKAELAEDSSRKRTLAILNVLKAMAPQQEEKKEEGEALQAQKNATEAFNTFFSFLKLPVGKLTLSNFSLKKDINESDEVKTCHDQLADPSKPITKSALLGEDGKTGMLFSLLGNLNKDFSINFDAKIHKLEFEMPEFIARLKNALGNKSLNDFIIELIREINRVKLMNYLDIISDDAQKAKIKAYGTRLTNEIVRSIYDIPEPGVASSNGDESKAEDLLRQEGVDASSEDHRIVINNFLRATGEVSTITSDLADKVGSFDLEKVINDFLKDVPGVKTTGIKSIAFKFLIKVIGTICSKSKLGPNDSKYPKLFNSYAGEDIDTLKQDLRYLGLKVVVTTELDENKYKSANVADAAYHGWCYVVANEFKDLDLTALIKCKDYKELWERYIEPFNIAAQKFGPEKVKAFLNKNESTNTRTLISLAQQYQAAAKAGDTVKVVFISEIYNDLFKGSEILGNLKLDLLMKNGLSVEQIQEFGDILKNPILKELVQVSDFTDFIKNEKDELLKEISRVEPSPHFYFLIATKGEQEKLNIIKAIKKQDGPLYEKMLSDIRIALDDFKNGKIGNDIIASKLDQILGQKPLSPELGEIDNANIARFQKLATISALFADNSTGFKLDLGKEDLKEFNKIKNQLENTELKKIVIKYFDGDPKTVHAFNAFKASPQDQPADNISPSSSEPELAADQDAPSQSGAIEVKESASEVEMTVEHFKLINAIRVLSDIEYWNRLKKANQDPKKKKKNQKPSVLTRKDQMIQLKDFVLWEQFNFVDPNPEGGAQAVLSQKQAEEKKEEEIPIAVQIAAAKKSMNTLSTLIATETSKLKAESSASVQDEGKEEHSEVKDEAKAESSSGDGSEKKPDINKKIEGLKKQHANACAKLRCLEQIEQLSEKAAASPDNKLFKADLALQQSVLQVLELQSGEQINKDALVEAKANVIACISAINCLVDKDHKMLNTQQIYALLDDAYSDGNSLQKLPTGSGKTFVLAVKAVMHALLGEQVYYQVPTKELRTQGFDDFKALYNAVSGLKAHVVRAGDNPEEFHEEGKGCIYLLTDTDIHFFLMDSSDSQKQAKSVVLADEMDKQYLQVKDYSECEILPQYSDDQERKNLFVRLLNPSEAVDLTNIPQQVQVLIQQAKRDLAQYKEGEDYFVDTDNNKIIRLLDGEVLSETADYISHFLAAKHDCIPPRLFKKGKSSNRAVLSSMLSNRSQFGTSGTLDADHAFRVDGIPLATTLWPERAPSRRVVVQVRPGDDNMAGQLERAGGKLYSSKVKGFTVKTFVQRFFKRSQKGSIFHRGGPNLIFTKDLNQANDLLNELLKYAKAKQIPDLNSLINVEKPLTILISTGPIQKKYVIDTKIIEQVGVDTLSDDPVNGTKTTNSYSEIYFKEFDLLDGQFREEAGKENVISIVTEDSGRGLDIHPEGKHGLIVCVTGLLVDEELTQQTGRAGRQGDEGKVYRMHIDTHKRDKISLYDKQVKTALLKGFSDQAAQAGSVQERNKVIVAQEKQAKTLAEQAYSDSMKEVLKGVVTQLTAYHNDLSSYKQKLTEISKLSKLRSEEKDPVTKAIKNTNALMNSLTTKIGAIQALRDKDLLKEEDKTEALKSIDSLEFNRLQSIHDEFKEAIKTARAQATEGVKYTAAESENSQVVLLEALCTQENQLNDMRGKNLAVKKINEGKRNNLKGGINNINKKLSEIFQEKDAALIASITEAKSQINSLKLDVAVVNVEVDEVDEVVNLTIASEDLASNQLTNKRTWPARGAIFLAFLALVALNLEYSGVFDYLNGVKPTFEFNELALLVSLAVFLLFFIPAILEWSTRTDIKMQKAQLENVDSKLSNKLSWANTFALVLVWVGAIAYNLKIDGVIDFLRGVEGAKLEVDGVALALSLLFIAACVVIISLWNTRSRIKTASTAIKGGDVPVSNAKSPAVPPAPPVAPIKQSLVSQEGQSFAESAAPSVHDQGPQDRSAQEGQEGDYPPPQP